MSEYTVTMQKTRGISDDECRKRLHEAYNVLLEPARRKRAVGDTAQSQAEGEQCQTE